MKRLLWIMLALVGICVLAAGTWVAYRDWRLNQVRGDLETIVARLPDQGDFHTVTVLFGASPSADYGRTCYYAQAYVVVGSELPEGYALDTYVSELRQQGWQVERDDLGWARTLVRGDNEVIDISTHGPGWIAEREESYQRARESYPTILFVAVTVMHPGRNQCW